MKTLGQYWQFSSFYFFYYATLAGWVPYWSVYLSARNYGAELIGLSVAAMMLMRIVGPGVWGYVVDLHQRHRLTLIRIGIILGFLGFSLLLLAETELAILLILLMTSFFWSGLLPQFEALTLSALNVSPEYYGWIRLWGSVGFICSVILCGVVFNWLSVVVLPYYVLALMACVIYASFKVPPEKLLSQVTRRILLRPLLTQPPVLGFLLSCVLVHLSHGPYYAFYSVYLSDYGYSHSTIGLLWALGVVAEGALFLWVPRVLARQLTPLFLLSILLAALRWFVIALSYGNLWMLLVAQLLHAASFGSFHVAGIEWIRRVFPGSLAGKGQALYGAVGFGIGGTLGALLAGFAWPLYGAMQVYFAAGLIALAGIVFALPALRIADRGGALPMTGQRSM